MILTEEEEKLLERLLTCLKCGSKVVEIVWKKGKYVKRCLKCGYEKELKEIEWE